MGSISDLQKTLKKTLGDKFVTTAEECIDVERLPTGLYPFDFATGGGFPRGACSIIWGVESSGKSNLALKAIAMNQILEPDKINVVLDIEHSFNAKWATHLGVDCDSKKLAVIQPTFAEQAVNIFQKLLEADDIGVIMLDSIGAMVTTNEVESDASKMAVSGAAMLITKMCKKMTVGLTQAAMDERYPTILIINQMRQKVGVMYGSPDSMPGGKMLAHQSSLTVKVRGNDIIDNEINKDRPSFKEVIGAIVKNKVPILAKEFKFQFPVTNQGGLKIGFIDDWNTVGNQLKELGWMYNTGKKAMCFDKEYKTYKEVRADLYSQPQLIANVRLKILEAYLDQIYGVETETD